MSDWNTSAGWNNGLSGGVDGASAGFSVGGPIGAVVGGIGGALSGLFGTKKKTNWDKKYFNESVRQFNIQDDYNKNRLQYTIQDALKAGVNPVTAISGAGGHYSPTISAGGSGGDSGYSTPSAARTVRNAIDERIARRQAAEDRKLSMASAALDLEGKRLQNDILRQRLSTETQPGIPKVGDLYLPWKDRNGNIVHLLNPDAIADADWSNLEALKAYASNPGDALSPGGDNWFRRFWYNMILRTNPLAEIYPNKKWR